MSYVIRPLCRSAYDHIVEGHPTIGFDYASVVERAPPRLLTCRRCFGRMLPFCHRHVRFD